MMAPVRPHKPSKHDPSGAIASRRSLCALALVACALGPIAAREQQAARRAGSDVLVYLGTYTGKESKGIYVSRLDMTTGALSPPQLAAETPSPSYLAIHPTRRSCMRPTK